jgi:hypothetical protein
MFEGELRLLSNITNQLPDGHVRGELRLPSNMTIR